MIGRLYAPGSVGPRPPDDGQGGLALGKAGREKVALERYEGQQTSDEFNAQIDALKKHPALDDLGVTTGPTAKLGPRMAPKSTKTVQDLKNQG